MKEDVGAPLLRVVRGEPTPEELAALVAVLVARASAGGRTTRAERPAGWAAYWRQVGAPLRPGPGAWRSSGLPR